MASHIPLALSLLGTLASHYPLGSITQKAAPPPPPSVAPTNATPSASALPSAPPATTTASNPVGNTNGTTAPAAVGSNGNTPPAINPVALCEVCHVRPKYFDGTRTHPYCSKSCASKKAGNGNTNPPGSFSGAGNNGNCNFCHNRPKYTDGTKVHDYCSKACARSANGPHTKSTGGSGGNSSAATCQAPGCQNPPHPGGHDYCSLAHKTFVLRFEPLGENLCLMCLQAPKMANSHFCSQPCIDDAESKGPMILEVPAGHVTFKSVADQFKASWRHVGTVCPPVRRVYKILAPPASLAAYNTYRSAVEARGQFVGSGRSEGNENRRWHGTRRVCNLGDKGHTQFCAASNCSLCCIIRTSYDISLWGKKTGWGRFGKGIYTSSTSSKSNDYSHNDCKSSLKAILLNKVVVGKGCKLLQDNTSLTAPPVGYDSVLAEKGGSLNYDELVVYTNDAIRPSFLVMYDEP
uniref:PARP catalytic domain-containing protein n=1 Tax=Psilocybe cubensis TaxID=181762 RepID=A0A8H7XXW0_PSICU